MASDFSLLLEATLAHLADLRARGERWVAIDPAALAALAAMPRPGIGDRAAAPRAIRPATPPKAGHGGASAVPPIPGISRAGGPPATPVEDRAAAMAELRQLAVDCGKCPHLARSRTQVVFGVGSVDSPLMFVGEAPGADEDRLGEPFVGRAGQLLTRIIQAMGYSRETVYIANVLKCRPDQPPGGRGNRPPREDEMATCLPYLRRQIEIIRPAVIVALGATAVQGLLGVKTTMGSIRGRWQEFGGIPVMPTYHPSYLLRAEDAPDRGHAEKRKTWEDLLQVLERLDRPITARMRGYFLKPGTGQGAP